MRLPGTLAPRAQEIAGMRTLVRARARPEILRVLQAPLISFLDAELRHIEPASVGGKTNSAGFPAREASARSARVWRRLAQFHKSARRCLMRHAQNARDRM